MLKTAGYKVAAYQQVHTVLQKQWHQEMYPVLSEKEKGIHMWTPSDMYQEPWWFLYVSDHGIIFHS